MNLTYHVQPSQRTNRDWAVFEQCDGPNGYFIEIAQFDARLEADCDAEDRNEQARSNREELERLDRERREEQADREAAYDEW